MRRRGAASVVFSMRCFLKGFYMGMNISLLRGLYWTVQLLLVAAFGAAEGEASDACPELLLLRMPSF